MLRVFSFKNLLFEFLFVDLIYKNRRRICEYKYIFRRSDNIAKAKVLLKPCGFSVILLGGVGSEIDTLCQNIIHAVDKVVSVHVATDQLVSVDIVSTEICTL